MTYNPDETYFDVENYEKTNVTVEIIEYEIKPNKTNVYKLKQP